MRLPAGHPEGYLEAMANLYCEFADAIRGPALPGFPGIEAAIRGMAFVEAAVASHHSDSKWTHLADIG